MPNFHSAIYAGDLMHHRLRPKQHRLRYSIFYLLLDLAPGFPQPVRG